MNLVPVHLEYVLGLAPPLHRLHHDVDLVAHSLDGGYVRLTTLKGLGRD
jgi:hypothetical protein